MTQIGRMRRLIIQTLPQDRIRSRLLKQTHSKHSSLRMRRTQGMTRLPRITYGRAIKPRHLQTYHMKQIARLLLLLRRRLRLTREGVSQSYANQDGGHTASPVTPPTPAAASIPVTEPPIKLTISRIPDTGRITRSTPWKIKKPKD